MTEQPSLTPNGEPDEVRRWFDMIAGNTVSERNAVLADLAIRQPLIGREVARLLEAYDRCSDFLTSPVLADPRSITQLPIDIAGRYRAQRILSEGGMGVVYEAMRVDDSFQKRVAIKMIRTALMTDALIDRFRVERQILSAMEHPNVARILDGGATQDGRPYLVMEFVDGLPIDVYSQKNNLGLESRLQLFLQICGAVHFAHQHLVVHRDLKPPNILVTEDGQVKLLDFGIAKILSNESGLNLGTPATLLQAMTPEYASPEQISGQAVTTGTDVFLLGICLYELVSGKHPYGGRGKKVTHEVQRAICEEDPPPVSTVARVSWRPKLRGDFDKIVAMALHKHPDRRYSSVEALAADIRGFLANEPILAQGDGFRYRASKLIRRRWLPLTAAAAVFAALTGAAVVSHRAAIVAQEQRLLAETRRLEAEHHRQNAERAADQAKVERALADTRRLEAERQHAIADKERARSQRNMEAQRALSMNLLTTSDTQFRVGNFKEAIANLENNIKAQKMLAESDPGDINLQKLIGILEVRLCGMRASSGDPQGASSECKSAIDLLEPHGSSGDKLLLASLGSAYATYGKLKTNRKETAEAISYGRKAIRTFEELRALDPENPLHQRSMALSQAYLAQSLFLAGEREEGISMFGKSVDALGTALKTNPADRTLVLGFASVLTMQSNTLLKAGDLGPARDAMRYSLSLFKALAEAPGATDLEFNEYANWLVRSEFSEMWRPQEALRFAQRAVRNSEEKNPGYLDTLAWAHYRMGNVAEAVEVQRKALRVIDGNAMFMRMPALKKEIQEGLKTFEGFVLEKK